ncbi:MAG TPA: hypothetical protein VEH76_01715 [Methylocystis sp.]|nr:hypothetical protein [Methylocystis sp.]
MSVSSFERDYIAPPGVRQIYARPLGALAASTIGVSALVILGLALAFGARAPKIVAEVGEAPQQQEWLAATQILSTHQSPGFDLSAPEFGQEKKSFTSRELEGGQGREDSLTIGQFPSNAPYLRLDLRPGVGEKHADFFLDLTRHAAAAGLAAIKIGQPSPVLTRFGAFEAADIRLSLATPETGASERACVALRLPGAKGGVEIAGLVCGAGAKPFERHAVGCILDRLERTEGGESEALGQLFQAADRDHGKSCDSLPTAAIDKASWFEAHSHAPEPKGDGLPPKHTKKAR